MTEKTLNKYVVALIEPTEQMEADGVMALIDAGLDSSDGIGPADAAACYKAMLSAMKKRT